MKFSYKQDVPVGPEPALDTSTYDGIKAHRTVLFIDLSVDGAQAKAYLGDRVKRLLESVNKPGMLVDLVGVDGRTLVDIPAGTRQIESGSTEARVVPFPASALNAWAADRGYQAALFITPAGVPLG